MQGLGIHPPGLLRLLGSHSLQLSLGAVASQLGSSEAGTCLQAFGSQPPQGAASEVLYEEVTLASS